MPRTPSDRDALVAPSSSAGRSLRLLSLLAQEGRALSLAELSVRLGLPKASASGAVQRLERSLLRLERINVQTLAMLQKLVNAVKKSTE
mgnify:CR=1 FL=1